MTPQQDLLTWVINQGVAVGVLVYLLVRLEARMGRLETLLQQLADRAFTQADRLACPLIDQKTPAK
jgi:hypothetical protein